MERDRTGQDALSSRGGDWFASHKERPAVDGKDIREAQPGRARPILEGNFQWLKVKFHFIPRPPFLTVTSGPLIPRRIGIPSKLLSTLWDLSRNYASTSSAADLTRRGHVFCGTMDSLK